jgi:hypothetical protein
VTLTQRETVLAELAKGPGTAPAIARLHGFSAPVIGVLCWNLRQAGVIRVQGRRGKAMLYALRNWPGKPETAAAKKSTDAGRRTGSDGRKQSDEAARPVAGPGVVVGDAQDLPVAGAVHDGVRDAASGAGAADDTVPPPARAAVPRARDGAVAEVFPVPDFARMPVPGYAFPRPPLDWATRTFDQRRAANDGAPYRRRRR